MGEILCKKKDCPNSEDEFHHIIPRFMGGKDINGRVYLCKKHHNMLHNIITSIIWKFVIEEKREKCRQAVKSYTEWWLEK
jgi:hypothetical protein